MGLLYEKLNSQTSEFLDRYFRCFPNRKIVRGSAESMIAAAKSNYDKAPYQKYLCENWYKSLETGQPAFHLYGHGYYFTDVWVCWQMYSRKYVRSLVDGKLKNGRPIHPILRGKVSSILDIGCGLGYSTAALKQSFPSAKVFGLNLADTDQFKFNQYLSNFFDFKMVAELGEVGQEIDLLFASEYFEHIKNPFENFQEIFKFLKPKILVLANSFNTYSYGHFVTYETLDGGSIDQSKVSRKFNSFLAEFGYRNIKTKNWNNKPAIWVRE